MHPSYQLNQYGQRHQSPPQQTDPSRQAYNLYPPPPPPPNAPGAPIPAGYHVPPPPPRRFPSQIPPPNLPPPPSNAPPGRQQWPQNRQAYYGNLPPPPGPPPLQLGQFTSQPTQYNPAHYSNVAQDSQPLTSATYIPSNGDSFGMSVGVAPQNHRCGSNRAASDQQQQNLPRTSAPSTPDSFDGADIDREATVRLAHGSRVNPGNAPTRAPDSVSTPVSTTAERLDTVWSIDRVTAWMGVNGFSQDWQETFRKQNIKGEQFLEIGRGHGGKGSFRILYDLVFPQLAKQSTESGAGWDQAREVEEGRRLRRLVKELRSYSSGRDPSQPASAATDDSTFEPLPFPNVSDNGTFAPFGTEGDDKSPNVPALVRSMSPTSAPATRSQPSRSFDRPGIVPTQDVLTRDRSRSRNALDSQKPKASSDDISVSSHATKSSRDITKSPALGSESSPRLETRSMHSREGSSQRNSAYLQGRTTPSDSYPGLSGASKSRYYSHRRNRSSETDVPRSATETSRPQMSALDRSNIIVQDAQQPPSATEASGRHASLFDQGAAPKEHRNILRNLFNRAGRKEEGHASPEDNQASSPQSPVSFRLNSFAHVKGASDLLQLEKIRPSMDNAYPFAPPAVIKEDTRKFVLVTPDGWNYRLVDVSGIETASQFEEKLCRELSLPDARDLATFITSPGQQQHEDALLSHSLEQALQKADSLASLKIFVQTPHDVALPTGTRQSFVPTSAKRESIPRSLTVGGRFSEQVGQGKVNDDSTPASASPDPIDDEKAATISNADLHRLSTQGKSADQDFSYRREIQRKGQAYRESRHSRILSPDEEIHSPFIRRDRRIDFDHPRVSPFENNFNNETLEPRRKPPPVPPETSTLKIANSLKRSSREEPNRLSITDASLTSPKRKGIEPLSCDGSIRGRRKAIADTSSTSVGVAGAVAGAAKLGMMGPALGQSAKATSRSASPKSENRLGKQDWKEALASVNINDSQPDCSSPGGSPRSPDFTMSKGNVPFKIPDYEDSKPMDLSLPPKGPARPAPLHALPNKLVTDLKHTERSPDVSPSNKHKSSKEALVARHSTRRGPQIDFKEEQISFNRSPKPEAADADDSDDGLFAMPIAPRDEATIRASSAGTIRSGTPTLTLQTKPSMDAASESFPTVSSAEPHSNESYDAFDKTVRDSPKDQYSQPIRRRPPRGSDADRLAKAARRTSFISDGWAARPAPETLVEHLDDFFPNVDLDQPVVEDHEKDESQQDAYVGFGRDTDDSGHSRSGNAGDIKKTSMQSIAQRNIRKSSALGRAKSIRDVVKGAYRPSTIKPDHINPRLSSIKNETMVRRRSTKMFGAKIEQIKPPRGSKLIHLETIPQDTVPQDTIDVLHRQRTFKWVKGQLIGKGSFGRVYLGMNTTTGELLAVKQVEVNPKTAGQDKDKIKEMVKSLDIEIDTMQHLDHVNIVQYLGCERKEYSISIFLEYISGGSIGSCLRKHGKFEEPVVASLTRQTLSGLKYLHDQGVLHRDLKADNILLDMDGTCKISDFGISKKTDDIYGNDVTNSMQGSVFWMAPEVVRSQGQGYSAKVDIWSLGCVVLEMFHGKRPWSKEEVIGAIYKLGGLNEAPPIPDEVASTISPVALSFMLDCFNVDPQDRPTADRLLRQPFCNVDPHFNFLDTELYRKIAPHLAG